MTEEKKHDIKVYIAESTEGRFYVVLEHDDGREEISDQSWSTRKECEAAIEKYARDLGVSDHLFRVQ